MMKKTITLLFATFLALGMSAQFSVGLDYMMLSGTMVKDAEEKPVTYTNDDGVIDSTKDNSPVLNFGYTHNLSEKLDMVGSIGFGMGFGIVPMKLGVSYAMTSKIDVNAGMGLYMITDKSFVPNGSKEGVLVENKEGNKNLPGMNCGVAYNMNAIGIGVGYEIISTSEWKDLSSITIGLSYTFGGEKSEKEEVKK